MGARTLVLWDVDHTLMETGGVGAELFRAVFEQATGRALEHAATVTGRTEPAIFKETAERQGITWNPELFDRYADLLARGYRQRAAEMSRRGRALPGAAAAIAALARADTVVQSVLTGNLRPVAQAKLETFALDDGLDLGVGAYGSDDLVRARLVGIARARASRKYQARFAGGATVLVGDTPGDVEAALDGDARIVAVASGRNTADELRQAGARIVLPDLQDTDGLVRAVLSQELQA
jgi:phosphoglycolate phosphatase-like HAD superfamily hydrolase